MTEESQIIRCPGLLLSGCIPPLAAEQRHHVFIFPHFEAGSPQTSNWDTIMEQDLFSCDRYRSGGSKSLVMDR